MTVETRPEYTELLNLAIPFAKKMIRKRGSFYPFGAAVHADGRLEGYAAGEGHDTSLEMIETLVQTYRELRANNNLRACALCYDSRVTREGQGTPLDTITLELEAAESCLRIGMHYGRRPLRGWRFGALFATSSTPRVFTP